MIESADLARNPILRKLQDWDPRVILAVQDFRDELAVLVPPQHLRRTAEFLRGDSALDFDFLCDIAAVDRFPAEPRFELNYQLLSIHHHHTLRLRVAAPGGIDPQVETLTTVWPAANWLERQIFDLFGVRFLGHPDLRRILMPDDWEGHPLRKDYPVEGYR